MLQIHRNHIAGEWVEGIDAYQNINPSDIDECVGVYAQASAEQMHTAIQAADAAKARWARTSPQLRSDVLDAVASEILQRRDELGQLLAREQGKVLADAVGEVTRAGHVFRYFAGEALRLSGETLPSVREGVDVEVLREPEGVIGIITPWNFPIAIPAWKIAAALAYGNCVVFKPAELVPGSAWVLADMLVRHGLPAGVFNLVMGRGSVVGDVLINSRQVNAITFTGSNSIGMRIITAGAARGAKVQVEMGGKNPLVVLDDADLEVAVSAALNGAFFGTGQRCTASSRLIVTESVHDAFVEAMRKGMAELQVDHALKPGSQIGPVVSQDQLQKNLEYIQVAADEGATLVCGGQVLQRETRGHYMAPALFSGTSNTMRINQEEIFGPVASVIQVADYEEALAVANETTFGLSSGICTRSLRHATDFKKRSSAGLVMVNLPTAGIDYHVPFGGRKSSSYGPREQGAHARDFFTSTKTAYIRSS